MSYAGLHSLSTKNHVAHAWAYADATARAAATGFLVTDLYKIALQQDDNSLWMLTAYSSPTWKQVDGGGAPVTSVAGRTGAVVLSTSDISGLGTAATHAVTDFEAALGNPSVTGYILSSTTGGARSWIAIPSAPVSSVAGRTGAVVLSTTDVSGLGTAATHDVPASGDASSAQVVLGSDTRLSVTGITTNQTLGQVTGVFDGGGAALTAGSKARAICHFAGTITGVTTITDQTGSVSIEVRKCTYANYDAGTTHPVTADKISAAAPATVSSNTKGQDTTLTGWTTVVSAGDVIEFYLSSVTTCTWVSCNLAITKS